MSNIEIRLDFGVIGFRLVDVVYVAECSGASTSITYGIRHVWFGLQDIMGQLNRETMDMLFMKVRDEVEKLK